jgi:thioredoxin
MKNLFGVVILLSLLTFSVKAEKVKKVDEKYFIENVFDFNKSEIVFKGDKPVILDMYADWCPPCKKLAPILDELSGEYKGKVEFIKVNTDHNKNLPNFFRVSGIPTMIYVSKTGKYFKSVGLLPKAEIKKNISKYFGIK